jgi:hypothetical protein
MEAPHQEIFFSKLFLCMYSLLVKKLYNGNSDFRAVLFSFFDSYVVVGTIVKNSHLLPISRPDGTDSCIQPVGAKCW